VTTGKLETTARSLSTTGPREPRLSLVFYHRDGAKSVVPGERPITLGRAWPADVVVDDRSVSREHARFWLQPDGTVAFEDLGSTNGVTLNGTRVPRGVLRAGDELRLGDVSAALHVLSSAAGVQGMMSYDALLRLLDDEIVRARTFGRPVTLLMLGGRGPQQPLPSWAPALLDRLRPVDRAAVYSGDAALVLIPESTRESAAQLAASVLTSVQGLRTGVASFPDDGTHVDELVAVARHAMLGGQARAQPLQSDAGFVVGERMRPVWDMVERVASSNLPVLVLGETGAGKEVVARALHERSARRDGPRKSVNCAAIPGSLVESVLFGHEKGSFTGAERAAKGLFEQAHGGTLLLDEVGELPPPAQAALLRVLETKTLVRVGGDRDVDVDVRVVAATHRDLERMCQAGTFRWDLFYRLHGVTIELPPLRERADEVMRLAEVFLRDACRDNGRAVRGFDASASSALLAWRWPGNIRELRNVVERAVVIARGDVVTGEDLPERVRHAATAREPSPPRPSPSGAGAAPAVVGTHPPPSASPPSSSYDAPPANVSAVDPSVDYKERLRREMNRYETQLIVDALSRAGGSVTAAAQALKIPVRTLTHKMQQLGIKKRHDAG
jgi:DNA-binding NtrC family response regulator